MEIKEALENMVLQHGFRSVVDGKPIIRTGGMSELEDAFEALGWNDPHELPEEGNTCEVAGCMREDACGVSWGNAYLRLCNKHYQASWGKGARPPIKQYALDREARRDPVTRQLP